MTFEFSRYYFIACVGALVGQSRGGKNKVPKLFRGQENVKEKEGRKGWKRNEKLKIKEL